MQLHRLLITKLIDYLQKQKHESIVNKMDSIHEKIIKLVAKSKATRYRISQDTGIGEAALSKFVAGTQTFKLDKLQTLAEYFGYEIVLKHKTRKRGY